MLTAIQHALQHAVQQHVHTLLPGMRSDPAAGGTRVGMYQDITLAGQHATAELYRLGAEPQITDVPTYFWLAHAHGMFYRTPLATVSGLTMSVAAIEQAMVAAPAPTW